MPKIKNVLPFWIHANMAFEGDEARILDRQSPDSG
jgi:hypothetical protein